MLVAHRHGGLGSVAAYTCSGGTCYGSANFAVFQNEINRLSAKVGLPSNLTVDGRIGVGTIAKFAVLAKRLKTLLGPYFAEELDDYTSTDIIVGMSTNVLANDISVLIGALQRNGVTMRCSLEGGPTCNLPAWAKLPNGASPPAPPVPILPPVSWLQNIKRPGKAVVAVGPTVLPGVVAVFPKVPKGVIVIAGALGMLAAVGLALGLAKRANAA